METSKLLYRLFLIGIGVVGIVLTLLAWQNPRAPSGFFLVFILIWFLFIVPLAWDG